jgi:hypothetical protein
MANTPNFTIRLPERVRTLLARDAERMGHSNMSWVARQILLKHYGLLKKVPA